MPLTGSQWALGWSVGWLVGFPLDCFGLCVCYRLQLKRWWIIFKWSTHIMAPARFKAHFYFLFCATEPLKSSFLSPCSPRRLFLRNYESAPTLAFSSYCHRLPYAVKQPIRGQFNTLSWFCLVLIRGFGLFVTVSLTGLQHPQCLSQVWHVLVSYVLENDFYFYFYFIFLIRKSCFALILILFLCTAFFPS